MRTLLLFPLLLVACKEGGDSGNEEYCADQPVLTWNNFGHGFMKENCQSCHASTSPNRNEAPEEVVFDDRETVLDRASMILAMATGSDPMMPPEGGVTEEDRTKLEIWLTCYPE